jgi:hypothetical protein
MKNLNFFDEMSFSHENYFFLIKITMKNITLMSIPIMNIPIMNMKLLIHEYLVCITIDS